MRICLFGVACFAAGWKCGHQQGWDDAVALSSRLVHMGLTGQ